MRSEKSKNEEMKNLPLDQDAWSSGKLSDCALRGLGFKSDRGPGQADSAFHSKKGGK